MPEKISFDFHCHSIYSDGRPNLMAMEEKCLKDNFNVVLTDHNEIRGSIKLYERNRITTLPALEAGSREGLEFLIYFLNVEDIEAFYKRAIEPYRRDRFMVQLDISVEKLLSIANEYNCFISLAHPFGFRKKSLDFHSRNKQLIETISKGIHAVESYNGNLAIRDNIKAQSLYNSDDYQVYLHTVGSDGHDIESLGAVTADFYTEDPSLFSSAELYEALRNNEFILDTKQQISKLKTLSHISISHTKYYFDKGKFIEKRIADNT